MSDEFSVVCIAFAAFTAAIMMGFGDRYWLKCKDVWNWFFNMDYIFGATYEDRYKEHSFSYDKPRCALCQYAFYDTIKHKWHLVDGRPKGTRNNLADVINATIERPGHTETKLQQLLDWQKKGYDIVFTSWNRWKCKKCGHIKNNEFYTLPSKSDGTLGPLVYDLNLKKQTQVIPPIGRREIPVEPMKKY